MALTESYVTRFRSRYIDKGKTGVFRRFLIPVKDAGGESAGGNILHQTGKRVWVQVFLFDFRQSIRGGTSVQGSPGAQFLSISGLMPVKERYSAFERGSGRASTFCHKIPDV